MSKSKQAKRAVMGFVARQFVKPDKRDPRDRSMKKETRDAMKELGVEQSPNTWNARAKKNPVAVKSVKVEAADIWNGDLPTADDTYNRRRAAVTAVAYPLIDFAEYGKRKDGRVVVSFPVEIVMPPDFTEAEVKSAVANLGSI